MNKTIMFAVLAILLVSGVVYAATEATNNVNQVANQNNLRGKYHDQVEQILETGTYADLVQLREETGMPLNRNVQSEEDFNLWQERHQEMEQYWEEQGISPGSRGYKNGFAKGFKKGFGMNNRLGKCLMNS